MHTPDDSLLDVSRDISAVTAALSPAVFPTKVYRFCLIRIISLYVFRKAVLLALSRVTNCESTQNVIRCDCGGNYQQLKHWYSVRHQNYIKLLSSGASGQEVAAAAVISPQPTATAHSMLLDTLMPDVVNASSSVVPALPASTLSGL